AAQQRADQIESFRAELRLLEVEGILTLDLEQQSQLTDYHNGLLDGLTEQFDIDSDSRTRKLSLGMKITSFLGALALGASLFFLFYQFWGRFSTNLQVLILVVIPILTLCATMYTAQREKTGYFSKLFGLVSLVCLVLNLSMLGQIFNIAPSPNAFVVWAAFAFLLAYAIDARLLLIAGILCISAYLSASMGTWNGCYWLNFGEQPENFFLAALFLFALSYFNHKRFSGFQATYRVFALLLFFIPVLILSNWGYISYLHYSGSTIEVIYQLVGFTASAFAIWLGIKKGWGDVVNLGNVFFTIFLYTKFYDWWWDWLPKYLFFLLIALVAILMLLVFKRLRQVAIGEGRR
ncbi:MAG: DUF2157 domain-containing protein, partial [Desulfuromonadales bacterium]|nr:DUF2157 domain-containing protein [Desulfuromonadales bacterium]